MEQQNVVEIRNLSKQYKMYSKPYYRLLEWLTFGFFKKHSVFKALNNVNITVKKGECLGIIGHNGAGKSTLLKILSKALWPSSGSIYAEGNMVSLLELGTGFHPELTGYQNIFNSGKLLGFSDNYLNDKLSSIIDFSELGDFIHQPVKSYSSGMYVRLAFSLYANLEPDIYVVDEALSVGDIFFQQKCFDFLNNLKSKGTAIILVTHDMQTVKKYCDRVLILEGGNVTHEGLPLEMVNLFYTMNNKQGTKNNTIEENLTKTSDHLVARLDIPIESKINVENAIGVRRGDGKVKIIGAVIHDQDGFEVRTVNTSDKIRLRMYAEVMEDINDLTFAFQFSDRHNTVVFGQNSYMVNKNKLTAHKGEIIAASFDIEMNLFQGLYTIMVAASDCQTEVGNLIYDWIEGCMTLEVMKPSWRTFHGIAYMPSSFNYESCLKNKEINDEQN
ncbi:ATP-binding cassette domain-containing protein [Paenibacillus sp. LMG 31456]|uniref:ATP-binding cassette domain-containing protein n=1 Tax=Paenibacillus foliorum TaxID=2654974 RepID=A0A972K1M7_9BACL|nr:ABC transporter ATP-binding protein [Paenibacillus foliorum]NOU92962.1 ATP-binding cassette domain-containing protein [Paenibacillus foliorum]